MEARSHPAAATSPLPLPLSMLSSRLAPCRSRALPFPLLRRSHFLRCLAVVDQLLCPRDTPLRPRFVGGLAVAREGGDKGGARRRRG